ncbi:MFS transporter [Nocardiopsis tropica]
MSATITQAARVGAPPLGWIGVVAVSLGNFMVAFDASGVNVALPEIAADLGAGTVARQWVLDGYTVPLCAVLLIAGVLGDRIGSTRVFRRATLTFVVFSVLCAVAPSIGVLIAMRIGQGAAAGFMLPMTLSVISRRIPQLDRRTRSIGVWGVVGGIAIAASPILAAVLVSQLGWWAVFLCNVPLSAMALALLPSVRDGEPGGRDIDWRGQALLALGLSAVAAGLIELCRGAVEVAVSCAVALVVVAIALVRHLRVASEPLVPPVVFNRAFTPAVFSGTCYQFAAYGSLVVLPVYFQVVRHVDVADAGLLMVPCCVGWLVGNVVALVAPRDRHRILLLTAPAIGAGAALAIALLVDSSLPAALAATAVLGVAAGVLASTLSSAAMTLATPGTSGISAGTFNVGRQLGMVIAVAVLGSATVIASPVLAFSVIAVVFVVMGTTVRLALRSQGARTTP